MSLTPHPFAEPSNGATASAVPFPSPSAVAPPHRAETTSVSDDAIAKLAYCKFIARGCAHGHDQDDWAAAKRDLLIGANGT